jgi:2,3-dihydroxybenzoate decarboxylase
MDSKGYFPEDVWLEVRERVLDRHGRRIRLMDEFGIEMMILSLNAPAVQAIPDARKANDIARKANDYLAEAVRKQPVRFRGRPPSAPGSISHQRVGALRKGSRHGWRAG